MIGNDLINALFFILILAFASLFLEKLYDDVVILRLMRECTVCTDLDCPSVLLHVAWLARAMFSVVQRAVAEQAAKIRKSLVARKILACPVYKKAIRIFHIRLLPFLMVLCCDLDNMRRKCRVGRIIKMRETDKPPCIFVHARIGSSRYRL